MSEYILKNSQGQAVKVSGHEIKLTKNEANASDYIRAQAAAMTKNDAGIDQVITTLTAIAKEVSTQKFYTVDNLSDYIPFDIGTGAWLQSVATFRSFELGQDFEAGVINQSTADGKLSSVDATVDMIQQPIKNWAKKISYSLFAMKQAAATGVFDYVSAQEKARKKNWDLGIQKIVFIGTQNGGKGLINADGPTVDTTTITKPFSSMDYSELNTFVATVAAKWYENNYATAKANRFVIPLSDFVGLSAFTNPAYPLITKYDALDKAFKAQFGGDFKILPAAYADASRNGLGGSTNRYALYNSEIETLKMSIPLQYNSLTLSTLNGFSYESVACGQFADGITVLRPQEILYFNAPVA